LEVTGSAAGGYTVRAVGPDGERNAASFDPAPLEDLATDLGAIATAGGSAPQQVGTALFQALFPMPILMLYMSARARLAGGEGLRLRLHLPSELTHLPWELLFYPPYFFCLDPTSPVVRFLDLPDPPRPLAVRPPLRLLYLVASPADAPRLDVEQEVDRIHAALSGLVQENKVEILAGRPGNQAVLRDRLRQGSHVLHFTGHGGFATDEGFLLFEDERGYGQPVNGDTLAHLLRGTSVRLAVLNACESATAGSGDAFSSVAAALVRAGLPAVIAYQHAMPDSSAVPFAAEFYGALADGYPVDAAVGEGRKAILSSPGVEWRERVDWATPVLFMQVPDGQVFAPAETGPRALATANQRTYVAQNMTAVDIETIQDGQFDFSMNIGATARPAGPSTPAPGTDSLPALLDELRERVRDRAPRDKRVEAMEKVATLRGAATEKRPNVALMESIWKWFDAELPGLSGAVLSAILGVKPRLEALGDDVVWDFEERFERR
jgi:hypothetical protein